MYCSCNPLLRCYFLLCLHLCSKIHAMPHKRTSEQKNVIRELEGFFEKKKAEQQALRKLLEELKKKLDDQSKGSTVNNRKPLINQ